MTFVQDHAEKIFDWILAVALVALNVLVFAQVVSRYLFNSPISWTEEMARLLFIWISFMGAFLALKTKGHIAVETLLHSLFKPAARVYVTAIADFLILYFCIYLAYMGGVMMQKTATDLTPVMMIPFSYLYFAIALSGTLMAVYLLIAAVKLERRILIVSFLASIVLSAFLYLVFGRGGFSNGNLVAVMLVSFFVFIAAGMPIAFAIGIGSLQFLLLYQKIPLVVTHTRLFGGVDSFPLLAVPFFILAGELMNIGGVTVRLVALAKVLVGHIRGGLGMVGSPSNQSWIS